MQNSFNTQIRYQAPYVQAFYDPYGYQTPSAVYPPTNYILSQTPPLHQTAQKPVETKSAPVKESTKSPVELNPELSYRVVSKGKNRCIVLEKVTNPAAVDIECKTISFHRGTLNEKGEIQFDFLPNGETHHVEVLNNGKTAFSMKFKPRDAHARFGPGKEIHIDNLFSPKNLIVEHDNEFVYELVKGKEPYSHTMKFDPKGGEVNLKLFTKRSGLKVPVRDGVIRLAKKNNENLQAPQEAPKAQSYPNYNTLYAPPPGYYTPQTAPMPETRSQRVFQPVPQPMAHPMAQQIGHPMSHPMAYPMAQPIVTPMGYYMPYPVGYFSQPPSM